MSAKKISVKAGGISPERVEGIVFPLRGQKVILDFHLAELYGVEARVLNQAVKRNIERFPDDFMFQLSKDETRALMRSQIVTSSEIPTLALRSQIVISKNGRGGRRYRPFVFTEQGVAMLSSVLRSPRAVQVNIEIMRTFVRLRQWLASNAELAARLDKLEKNYDKRFKIIFEAIRELMRENKEPRRKREIGFHAIPNSPLTVRR
jgi:hypothetical protein